MTEIPHGEEHSRANLVKGLTSECSPNEAEARANEFTASVGGKDEDLKRFLDRELGRLGAQFFNALLNQMLASGQPLLSNMRSYYGSGGPDQVWNQMFFYCKANYAEAEGNNNRDIVLTAELYSNIDQMPSAGLPGAVANGIVTPGKSGTDCQLYTHTLKLRFSPDGRVAEGDPSNEWRSIRNDKGEELYAPTNLVYLTRPDTETLVTGDPVELGNPVVGPEFLVFAKAHARFR